MNIGITIADLKAEEVSLLEQQQSAVRTQERCEGALQLVRHLMGKAAAKLPLAPETQPAAKCGPDEPEKTDEETVDPPNDLIETPPIEEPKTA